MAVTTTTNLKLRVDSSLSPDSKYNLYKIDNLASLYQVDANSVARVRSRRGIVLQPEDPDIGGSGTGGTISFGSADQPVEQLSIHADAIELSSPISSTGDLSTSGAFVLKNGAFQINLVAPTLSASYTLTLPPNDGIVNQVLTTDGAGNLSWESVATVNVGQEFTATWVPADGLIKTINHGLGTRSIIVQVLDSLDDYKTVEVTVSRPTVNTVVLESSTLPVSWVVLLKQIP
jgi:hypothetical protein